jgi:IS30 family transposase
VLTLKDKIVRSISLDNGTEFRTIEKKLNTLIYFAHLHAPWERGTNENTNGLLRFFFEKGYDFRKLTQEHLDKVLDLINNRPRKCLGWLSPIEFLLKKGVALH